MAKARRIKGIKPDAPVIRDARRIILVRLEELLSWTPYIDDPANVPEIHHMRIAAKRLRYTLELFRPILPKGTGGLIDEVKEIQEHIGTMHDADVMIERVVGMITVDGEERMERMLDIATSTERGSVAQRRQRMRSAAVARNTVRDEVALYTLVAHHADLSEAAYHDFIRTWHHMMETDFVGRLRRHIGVDPELPDNDEKKSKSSKSAKDSEQRDDSQTGDTHTDTASTVNVGSPESNQADASNGITSDATADVADADDQADLLTSADTAMPVDEAMKEVEAKLVFDESDESTILTLTELGGLALEERRTVQQVDIYLDTDDRMLEQERATVRVRRIDDEWRMTFKGPSVYHQVGETTVKSRTEDEAVISADTASAVLDDPQGIALEDAPSPLRRARDLVGGAELQQIARIENRRTILTFAGLGREAIVDLMVDRCNGLRMFDGRIVSWDELEAEVRGGGIDALRNVLEDLRHQVPSVEAAVRSKLGRVMGDEGDESADDAPPSDDAQPSDDE